MGEVLIVVYFIKPCPNPALSSAFFFLMISLHIPASIDPAFWEFIISLKSVYTQINLVKSCELYLINATSRTAKNEKFCNIYFEILSSMG